MKDETVDYVLDYDGEAEDIFDRITIYGKAELVLETAKPSSVTLRLLLPRSKVFYNNLIRLLESHIAQVKEE